MKSLAVLFGFFSNLPGFLFTLAIGLAAWVTASYLPGLNSIVLGLLAGILLGNILRIPWALVPGIAFSGARLLELAIVFLAFSISLKHIQAMGLESFLAVLVMIAAVLAATLILSRKMGCPGGAGFLTGFGSAICGSSAIAALSSGIRTQQGDVAMAMAVVNLMGAIGMVALPLLLGLLSLSDEQNGLIIGASLHSVGNVAGAGFALGDMVGAQALTIKLARVALLTPAVIVFTYLINRSDSGSGRSALNLPFYLWAFVAITVFTSFVDLPANFLAAMDIAGKVSLTIAMVAIGLSVSFKQLYKSGKRVLVFGALIFVLQLLILAVWITVAG